MMMMVECLFVCVSQVRAISRSTICRVYSRDSEPEIKQYVAAMATERK